MRARGQVRGILSRYSAMLGKQRLLSSGVRHHLQRDLRRVALAHFPVGRPVVSRVRVAAGGANSGPGPQLRRPATFTVSAQRPAEPGEGSYSPRTTIAEVSEHGTFTSVPAVIVGPLVDVRPAREASATAKDPELFDGNR